jgi:hypothetical protein
MSNAIDAASPLELFCSYSTDDEEYRRAFERSLAGLRRAGLLTTWNFRKILPGENLDVEISAALKRADIVVLLVSSSFLDSEYSWNIEMRAAIDRHDRGEARIVPVIVRSCLWGNAPFSRLNALPKDAKPIASWANVDEAWTSVAQGVQDIVQDVRSGRQVAQILEPVPEPLHDNTQLPVSSASPDRDSAGLLTSYGAMLYVLARSPEGAKPVDEPLMLYENSFQRTWLIFLADELVCVLDDVTKRRRYDPIRWRSPTSQAKPVRVRPYRASTGTVDFGDSHAGWLYSLKIHPDPEALLHKLETLLSQ